MSNRSATQRKRLLTATLGPNKTAIQQAGNNASGADAATADMQRPRGRSVRIQELKRRDPQFDPILAGPKPDPATGRHATKFLIPATPEHPETIVLNDDLLALRESVVRQAKGLDAPAEEGQSITEPNEKPTGPLLGLAGMGIAYAEQVEEAAKDVGFLMSNSFMVFLAAMHVLIPAMGVWIASHWNESAILYVWGGSAAATTGKLVAMYLLSAAAWAAVWHAGVKVGRRIMGL